MLTLTKTDTILKPKLFKKGLLHQWISQSGESSQLFVAETFDVLFKTWKQGASPIQEQKIAHYLFFYGSHPF